MTDKHASLKMEDLILNPVVFQNILYEARDIIMFFNIDGKTIYANKAAENLYGYSKEDFYNIYIQDLSAAETMQEIEAVIKKLTNSGHLFCTVHKRRDGGTFPVEISAKLHEFNQRFVIVCLIRDISEIVAVAKALKNSEYRYHLEHEDLLAAHKELAAAEEDLRQQYKSLRISEEKFSKVFNFSPDVMAITRLKDGMYIDVNPSFTKLAGCTKEEVIGKTSLELGVFTLENRDCLIEQLHNKGEVRNLEIVLHLKNGSSINASMSAGVFNIENEQYLLTITRDITKSKQIEEQLRYLSLHDSLTKLHNRACFEEQFMQLQKSGNNTVGLLMCDVDGLKIINDTLGHHTGDIILQTVANI